jgi:hypothetical protein
LILNLDVGLRYEFRCLGGREKRQRLFYELISRPLTASSTEFAPTQSQ